MTSNTKTEESQTGNYNIHIMKKIIQTPHAPAPIGPYNQAVQFGNLLYTSGQIAIDPKTGELLKGDVKAETKLVMENLKAVLEAASASFEQVIKTTIFVSDMANFSAVNEVYGSYFDDATAPARETVEVANLPKYVQVEISMIVGL